jgi:hypothetical protein
VNGPWRTLPVGLVLVVRVEIVAVVIVSTLAFVGSLDETHY